MTGFGLALPPRSLLFQYDLRFFEFPTRSPPPQRIFRVPQLFLITLRYHYHTVGRPPQISERLPVPSQCPLDADVWVSGRGGRSSDVVLTNYQLSQSHSTVGRPAATYMTSRCFGLDTLQKTPCIFVLQATVILGARLCPTEWGGSPGATGSWRTT